MAEDRCDYPRLPPRHEIVKMLCEAILFASFDLRYPAKLSRMEQYDREMAEMQIEHTVRNLSELLGRDEGKWRTHMMETFSSFGGSHLNVWLQLQEVRRQNSIIAFTLRRAYVRAQGGEGIRLVA